MNLFMQILIGLAAFLLILYIFRNPVMAFLHRIPKIGKKYVLIEAPSLDSDDYTLTPAITEGPFFFRGPQRSDIREGKKGLRYDLEVQLTDESGAPLVGYTIECWNCDIRGEYSGYDDDLGRKPFKTFTTINLKHPDGHAGPPPHDHNHLRGAQNTDENGMVKFTTVFPGWYDPRIPHVHFKIYKDDTPYLKTQLYFPLEFSNNIYTNHPDYVAFKPNPYTYKNDLLLIPFDPCEGFITTPKETEEGIYSGFRFVIKPEPHPMAAA